MSARRTALWQAVGRFDRPDWVGTLALTLLAGCAVMTVSPGQLQPGSADGVTF